MTWRSAALLLIALASALPPSVAGDGQEGLRARPADRGTLEQAIAESRAVTSPPRPGVSRYVGDAGIAFSEWLAGVIERLLPGFGRIAEWFLATVWGLLLALLAVVAVLLGIGLARRWWRDRSVSRPPATPLPAAVVAPGRSAEDWEAELHRALAGGDVAAAVEALWWWLASVLTEGDVDPSWTSRELVVHAGRTDLRPWIRRLDRMLYGRGSPPAEDVRHLFADLRTAA